MKPVFRQSQLFTFLLYCNGEGLEKTILDCGAGGNCPPLAIFAEQGYKTIGIENSEKQIQLAQEFEKKHGLNLGIQHGDMKKMPFENGSINYVYSYNSIFHMGKKEIGETINEIKRVMPVGGLAFINFASEHDDRATLGEEVGDGEFIQVEFGEKILHSYFRENEVEPYFEGFKIWYKENRIREGYNSKDEKIKMGFLDFIVQKL